MLHWDKTLELRILDGPVSRLFKYPVHYEIYFLSVLLLVTLLYYLFHWMRVLLLIVSFFLVAVYMEWRTFDTLTWSTWADLIASITLLVSEYLGFIQQGIFYFLMASGTKERQNPERPQQYYPSVDVFVPTFNEPVQVLRRTLVACTYLDYPKNKLDIYVLDDGERNEVENLAKELQIHYIRRKEHAHAKAGNLNHALDCTQGELILTLDADMVPKSNFLMKTVGYFNKRRVGFVQAPQLFFNPDPFQHNLSSSRQVSNEQDFFMIEMEAAKDHYNAPMYVGSNCIFSRQALNQIGGFATGSITEDVATGMLLQAKGYRTYFVKEVLAKGLAPESFSELLHQRERWARGNLQAFRKWNPLIFRGLSFPQRLFYFSGAMYWYFGVQKMIYILAPIVFLDFQVQTLHANLYFLLIYWFPQFYASMLTFRALAKGHRTAFWSHIYETAMAPSLAKAAIQETFRIHAHQKFRVTRKGFISEGVRVVWSTFLTHLCLGSATIYGLERQVVLLKQRIPVSSFYWVNDFWAVYNLIAIMMSLYVSIELPRRRLSERVPLRRCCRLQIGKNTYQGESLDISETGLRAVFSETVPGFYEAGRLILDGVPGELRVDTVFVPGQDRFERRLHWGELPLSQYRPLVQLLYDQPENIMQSFYLKGHYGAGFTLLRATRGIIHNFSGRPHIRRTSRKITHSSHLST